MTLGPARTTTDTYTGKRFRWNTTARVEGLATPAWCGANSFFYLHPTRTTTKLLLTLNKDDTEARRNELERREQEEQPRRITQADFERKEST